MPTVISPLNTVVTFEPQSLYTQIYIHNITGYLGVSYDSQDKEKIYPNKA